MNPFTQQEQQSESPKIENKTSFWGVFVFTFLLIVVSFHVLKACFKLVPSGYIAVVESMEGIRVENKPGYHFSNPFSKWTLFSNQSQIAEVKHIEVNEEGEKCQTTFLIQYQIIPNAFSISEYLCEETLINVAHIQAQAEFMETFHGEVLSREQGIAYHSGLKKRLQNDETLSARGIHVVSLGMTAEFKTAISD